MYRILKVSLFICVAFAALPQSAWSRESRFDDVDRVVAIADIHGAYDAMVATLKSADILGEDLSWSGAESHLVIVGDILDRGPKSRAAMDLLMRIESEAAAAGGKVHVLIGNHESMILTGDMRYVSAAEYQAFAGEEDPVERSRWFELFVERHDGDADEMRAPFDKKFPPGYFAMRRAFRADGYYGQWLLDKNIIAVINGTAFVHGGLPPVVTEVGLSGVNGRLQSEMVEYVETLGVLTDAEILLPTDSHYDYEELLTNYAPSISDDAKSLEAVSTGIRFGDSDILSTDGPLWYRNHVMCPRIVEEHRLDAALKSIGANRVVVGHTPTPTRQVTQRFNGRLIEIDTGMLNFYYNGIGHALVLAGDSLSIMNQHGLVTALPVDQQRKVGHRAKDLTAADLEILLEKGEIIDSNEAQDGIKRTLLTVSDGQNTVSAVFTRAKSRGIYPGVAAYRTDRILELDMVPVTVVREVDGSSGSLQFMPDRRTDEVERSTTAQGGGAWCSLSDQWPSMYAFDVLIFNEGRTPRRMLYDKSSWRLILSEHDRAFSTRKGRPAHLKNAPVTVSPGWRSSLERLTDAVLAEQLGDVLDKRRLKSLAARRDQLLATR